MNTIESILIRDGNDLQDRANTWMACQERLLPIIEALEELDATITFPNTLDIKLTGDGHKLAAAVRILRIAGFKPHGSTPKANDPAWYTHFYAEDENGLAYPLKFWLAFTSSVCRRVLVGTKTVEQDVYKTVCG